MTKEKVKKKRFSSHSKHPYVRRDEEEMAKIIGEISSGMVSIRGACLKYGLCRNTLKLWITKQTVRTLEINLSAHQMTSNNENVDSKALQRKIYELTRALEHANLKISSLETLIKVSEEDLKIKIRKKPGTKQSKE